MTYKELLEELKKFSEEQLELTAMFYNTEEGQYYAADIVPACQGDAENCLGGPENVPYPVIVTDVQPE